MGSEGFQEIVLEHLARITQEITTIKTEISTIKTEIAAMKTDISVIKTDVAALKNGQETIKEQTAQLTEFKTATATKFEKLMDYMDYFKVHLVEVDTELLRLKKKIS